MKWLLGVHGPIGPKIGLRIGPRLVQNLFSSRPISFGPWFPDGSENSVLLEIGSKIRFLKNDLSR